MVERFHIDDESSFQMALLQVKRLLMELGFKEVQSAKFLTAVSELARNILKYANNGVIEAEKIKKLNVGGLRVVAIDHGPGIENVERALQENYSSTGTLGQGLPGARRLVDEFAIESSAKGTIVTVCSWCE